MVVFDNRKKNVAKCDQEIVKFSKVSIVKNGNIVKFDNIAFYDIFLIAPPQTQNLARHEL